MCASNGGQRDERNGSHVVQLYDANERALGANVVSHLTGALAAGGGAIVIATPGHTTAFLQEIARNGIDTEAAIRSGLLVTADAKTTLARLMTGGHPNAERFDRVVGTIVRDVTKAAGQRGVRAYGEMVGLLWQAKQFPAAIRLEQLWNKLQNTLAFDLFCAYPIDIFDRDFDVGVMDALLCAHTHLLPSGADPSLQAALRRAIDEFHGLTETHSKSSIDKIRSQNWAVLPEPEATILWLRANVPDSAEAILSRAQSYYQATA